MHKFNQEKTDEQVIKLAEAAGESGRIAVVITVNPETVGEFVETIKETLGSMVLALQKKLQQLDQCSPGKYILDLFPWQIAALSQQPVVMSIRLYQGETERRPTSRDPFTDFARRAIVRAEQEAQPGAIETQHLLLGLLFEQDSVAAKVLESISITQHQVRNALVTLNVPSLEHDGVFSPGAARVIQLSCDEARELGHNYIGTKHLLLGLLCYGEGVAIQILNHLGVDIGSLKRQVKSV